MTRNELLGKFSYTVPEQKKIRVIVNTDAKNEADDQYAIMHHLMTPYFDLKGFIAAHFEAKYKMMGVQGGTSMEESYQELVKLMDLAEVEDVPLYKGAKMPISTVEDIPESEGADFIIREAMKADDRPLYVAFLGCLTDLAIAYQKEPAIADKLTAIWIGGGAYPQGGMEFNLLQDIEAARVVFESPIPLWQIPSNTYNEMEVSLAELDAHVKPCGKIGEYLFNQMNQMNIAMGENLEWPHGETWCIGDQPTISVLLQSRRRETYHLEKAPIINDDMTYSPNPQEREIRVYDSVDVRMTIGDFFDKLKVLYG